VSKKAGTGTKVGGEVACHYFVDLVLFLLARSIVEGVLSFSMA
jgi:hypothetical protein